VPADWVAELIEALRVPAVHFGRPFHGRAPELICDWGFGPAGHFGGHKAPGSWMLGHALRLLGRPAGPRLHADLAACND
jgi:hypothetical protein